MCAPAFVGFALLVAAGPSPSAPDPRPALPLTIGQAISKARAHAPEIGRLADLEAAAAAGIAEARAGRLPAVDLQAGYTRSSDVPELSLPLPGGGSQVIYPNIPDQWRARLGVSIPLYTGGRLAASSEAASASRQAASGDAAAGEADVVLETAAAYWSLATARESERVLREGFAAYERHLADARARALEGVAPRSDVLRVQVERDRAELAVKAAGYEADVAAENLARLTGVGPGVRIEIAEPLGPPAAGDEGVEDLVARAIAARPERAALAARRSALEASARAEEASRLPHVAANAGYDYARPNRDIFPLRDSWKGTWDVSLSASLSLFDGGRSRASAARARASAGAIGRSLDDFDGRVRLDVVSRYRELQTALDAVSVATRAVEAAAEAARILRDRYLEGVSTNGDYLDAESALLGAGLERVEALARSRLAAARLDRAVGR